MKKKSSKSKVAKASEPVREEPVREELVVAGHACQAGERARFEIPVARLQTGGDASLPVCVLHGAKPGPTIWMDAAIHGDELNGVEIIRQVLSLIDPKTLSGSLIAVPIVNVFGYLSQSRYLPDRRDLNRSFPGSARGSLASRLAHMFVTEVVERCTIGLDFHTGSDARTNLPQIRADLDDPETRRLAEAFAAPVTLGSGLRDGSLRKVAFKAGARVLLYEAGEPLRFGKEAIDSGVVGALRVMHALDMLDSCPDAQQPTQYFKGSKWVRASLSGLFHLTAELGSSVAKGDQLGFLTLPDAAGRTPVKSITKGVVIGHVTNPVVFQGDALVHVTS